MNTYIGIDVGTSGTKTLLISEDGTVLRTASRDYPLSQPQNGWAEQDPALWWNAACETLREVLSGTDKNSVRGVGLTGQMHGLVCLDKHDNVLRPAILWCDQRTAAECAEITQKVGAKRLIELTANPALTGFTAPKILWIRNNEPDIYAQIDKMMLPKDYIRYMLTGDNASDVSDASGTGLLNVARRCRDDEVLQRLEIDGSALGRLYESCEITGTISQKAAEQTGLPAGTPVAAGAGDNAAAAIGTGVARDGQSFVTIGTSGVVFAHTSKMTLDPGGRIHAFCSAVPGEWHVMGVTLCAGQSRKWLRENFMSELSYDELDKLAQSVPIGANRLLFLPYLNGERSPHLDPDARGAFFGLSSIHGRAELVRAVMEGVIYSLCDCRDIIAEMGVDLNDITACGGGSQSALWRQMLADSFGANVGTVQTADAPALGAAMLAAVGTGAYKTVPEACDTMIRQNGTQKPDTAAGSEYARFHALYKTLYPAMREGFARLAGL